jgi:arylsulfatase A-like enzyme
VLRGNLLFDRLPHGSDTSPAPALSSKEPLMHTQTARILLAGVVSLFLLAGHQGAAAQSPRRPNVIIILADDLGYGDLSIHGSRDVSTPHIDSIARTGVRCTGGYVSAPYCSPSRAGLLTGRYQQRFGHEFNPQLLAKGGKGQGLAPSEVTLAARLKAAGYATGLLGKWHQGEEDRFHPLNRGFSEFFGFLPGAHPYFRSDDKNWGPIYRGRQRVEVDGYLTDVLAREAVAFIDRHRKEPFFLYLAFNAVHTPLEVPEAVLKQFARVKDPKRRIHLAMTAALDTAVGKVLDKLRSAGMEENTLIFFLSDNGGPTTKFAPNASSNGPLRGSKGDTWEGGIRVPFFVRWKGHLPAGKLYDHPVIALDIHATALAAAGIAARPEWKLDGVNLLPFLKGENAAAPHAALFWRFGEQMAVRAGDWKLVRPDLSDREFGRIAGKPMLFNLREDIGEKNDLAAKHPDRVKELLGKWQGWNKELAPPAWLHHSLQKRPK